MYYIHIGESGLVYKGYIDTPSGSELVAIKTGKGKELCSTYMMCGTPYIIMYSTIFLW